MIIKGRLGPPEPAFFRDKKAMRQEFWIQGLRRLCIQSRKPNNEKVLRLIYHLARREL